MPEVKNQITNNRLQYEDDSQKTPHIGLRRLLKARLLPQKVDLKAGGPIALDPRAAGKVVTQYSKVTGRPVDRMACLYRMGTNSRKSESNERERVNNSETAIPRRTVNGILPRWRPSRSLLR